MGTATRAVCLTRFEAPPSAWRFVAVAAVLLLLAVLGHPGVAAAQGLELDRLAGDPADAPLAALQTSARGLAFAPSGQAERWVLTVKGPSGFEWQKEFQGRPPAFAPASAGASVDGVYSFSLQAVRPNGDGPNTLGGSFKLAAGAIVGSQVAVNADGLGPNGRAPDATPGTPAEPEDEPLPSAPDIVEPGTETEASEAPDPEPLDFVIIDDLIVDGSACIGTDCVNGESFGFDTLRLKENNLRIKFQDTSNSASFPTNDWQLTANDSSNGGKEKFSIDDITGGRTPFTVEAGAPSHSLYVEDGGRIGLGTDTPVVEVHVKDGDTPTVRLEQDGSSGFSPQTWDMAGNETNFFIRDVTNGSALPFRIRPSAPSNSIFIDTDGDVGIGTSAPDSSMHVFGTGGDTKLTVEEASGSTALRTLLDLQNKGTVAVSLYDTRAAQPWVFLAEDSPEDIFAITKAGTGVRELFLDTSGNLEIQGNLMQGSSRAIKENVGLATGAGVLERLMTLPIYEWSYHTERDRHVGPMAEDFWQAFGLAGDGTHIAPGDMAGVALAAVQELAQIVQQQQNMLVGYRTAIADMGGDPDAVVPAEAGDVGAPLLPAGIIGGGGSDVADVSNSTVDAPDGYVPARSVLDDGDSTLLRSMRAAIEATDGAFPDDREVVRVYKNYDAWWGENRDAATLSELGKSRGYDWFVHEVSELWTGVPEDTDVIVMTSASSGNELGQIDQQTSPVAQASLDAFVNEGGTLLISLADNDDGAGYEAPGADGTPELLLPSDCRGATLANPLYGSDRLAGTADDHPLLAGPDRLPASEDDLTPFDVGLRGGCYVAHGNLAEGMTLPEDATVLMTADFGGVQQPVLAEYALGEGRVVVTTLTMEFMEHSDSGTGASKFLANLFSYAIRGFENVGPDNEDPHGVRQIKR